MKENTKPIEWEIYRLDEIASIERGKFSARPRNDPQYYGGNIPFLQTGDVSNSNGFVTSYRQTLNEAGLGVSRLFEKGTFF
jgi:type I restriction enzyme S subunit